VLDYKTGDTGNIPSSNPARIEAAGFSRQALKATIKSFQLPLYLYFVLNDKRYTADQVNAALYSIKDVTDNQGLVKLFKTDAGASGTEKTMKAYIRALESVVCDILDPKTPFVSDEDNPRLCENCQFFYMCR
jgi:hypothetical protein